nr:MAG TPA: hypothetical protein [Caudoviricetes sp.]
MSGNNISIFHLIPYHFKITAKPCSYGALLFHTISINFIVFHFYYVIFDGVY